METWSELTVPGLKTLNNTGCQLNSSNTDAVKTNGRCFRDPSTGFTFHSNNFQYTTGMGGIFNSNTETNARAGGSATPKPISPHGYTIPLYFWFCRNPGLALPLIALQYHEVKINLTLGEITSPDTTLWVDYIYLDTDERRRFAQVSHEYLIEQLQFQSFGKENTTLNLNFNHPVKELIWTGAWINASGFPTNMCGYNSTNRWGLKLNGHDRFTPRGHQYFAGTQIYQHHSGDGAIDYFGDETVENIHVYSFALKPEEHQPSGTCNFSRIDNAQLVSNGNSDAATIFAVNYNVLRIMSGMGGLAYSN